MSVYNTSGVPYFVLASSIPVGANVIGAVTQSGTWNVVLSAGTNYAGKFRPTDGTNDITLNTAPADASSNTVNTMPVLSYLMGFNGTTWDRVRFATNALNSVGTGIQAAQIVGQFDDTSPTSITENQFGNLRMSANRNLYGTIRDAAGNERGVNVNASNQMSVSVDNTPAVTATGNIAHDAVDSGNPVKIGGVARNAAPTAVSNGDRADLYMDLAGRPVVTIGAPRELKAWQQTTITSSTSETTIVTAGGAGVFNDLTGLEITNSSASATIVTLKDSTAGTTRGIWSLAAGGGIVINMQDGMGVQSSANNNWTLTCGTSVASIYVVARFNKNK